MRYLIKSAWRYWATIVVVNLFALSVPLIAYFTVGPVWSYAIIVPIAMLLGYLLARVQLARDWWQLDKLAFDKLTFAETRFYGEGLIKRDVQ